MHTLIWNKYHSYYYITLHRQRWRNSLSGHCYTSDVPTIANGIGLIFLCVVNSFDVFFHCLPVADWQKMAQLLMGMPRQPFKQSSTYPATGENDPASQLFDQFCSANTFHGIMDTFQQLCDIIGLRPVDHQIFYKQLKTRLLSWKAQSLWTKLDKRAANLEYRKGTACNKTRV